MYSGKIKVGNSRIGAELSGCTFNLLFVDLDDTLIEKGINNTFDFLKSYLFNRYKFLGLVRYAIASSISWILSKLIKNSRLLRKLSIVLLTFGMRIDDMLSFAVSFWLRYIERNLNPDVMLLAEKLKRHGYLPVLLTACIEVPAKVICRYLKFHDCIVTEFKLKNGRIVGILTDTYGPMKFVQIIRKYGYMCVKNSIYIADKLSIDTENAYRFVDNIVVV